MGDGVKYNIPVESFKELCRVCLSVPKDLVSIHEVVFAHSHNTDGVVEDVLLSNVFYKYCNVLVHKDDFKPQNICQTCINMVAKAFNIFEIFQVSNTRLNKILTQHGLKWAKERKETLNIVTIPANEMQINSRDNENNSTISLVVTHVEPLTTKKAKQDTTKAEKSLSESRCINVLPTFPVKIKDNTFIKNKENIVIGPVANAIRISKIESRLKPLVASGEADDTTNAQEILVVVSDSESDDNHLESVDFNESIDQDIEDNNGSQGAHSKDLILEAGAQQQSPSLIVSPPTIGREKWDHTYYVRKVKCLRRRIVQERSRKLRKRMNNGGDSTQCPICGLVLKYKSNLPKHLRTHNAMEERKTFLCEHCAKSFTTSSILKRHVLLEHESNVHVKKLRMEVLRKTKEARIRYKAKQRSKYSDFGEKNEYCCEYCPKIFTSKGPFFKHRISHPECTNIACPFCDRVFESSKKYKSHRIDDHSSFLCVLCNKGYPSKDSLIQHKANIHKACNYQCSYCPRTFKNSQVLRSHQNIHEHVRPYSCQYCNKTFIQKNHVVQHEAAKHTKVKKHQCKMCDKSFSYTSVLKAHIRSHLGVKPFACPYCSKKFTDTMGRHKHVKQFHPGKMDDFTAFKKKYQSNEAKLADCIPAVKEKENDDEENMEVFTEENEDENVEGFRVENEETMEVSLEENEDDMEAFTEENVHESSESEQDELIRINNVIF